MQTTVHFFLLLLLVFQARGNDRIIGKWESVETTDGARTVLEFGRNGLFLRTVGLAADGIYRVEGNHILTDGLDSGAKDQLDSLEFKVENDALFLKTTDGEVTLRRLGPRPNADVPIMGKWGVKGEFFHGGKNGTSTIEFTQDGHLRTRIQAEPRRGRYRIKGDLLTTSSEGETQSGNFRFEEGLLIITPASKSGGEERYKRLQW